MQNSKSTFRYFTFLEVMIGLVIITLFSGLVGLKMNRAVQKKEFQSQVERLKTHFVLAHRLAISMHSDWQGVFTKQGDQWNFELTSEEKKTILPLHLSLSEISFNGEVINPLIIDFYATGEVSLEGTFSFKHHSHIAKWKTAELFQRKGGTHLGPLHPNDS